jgi:hypothetical protein
VGFVADKVALGQGFSEYFGFPCKISSHKFLHNHHHLSSGAGKIGQQWPQYPKSHPTNLKEKSIADVFYTILLPKYLRKSITKLFYMILLQKQST